MAKDATALFVDATLSAHAKKYKSTDVTKAVPLQLDLGHLMAYDLSHDLDRLVGKPEFESSLHTLARDNAQLLFNALFELPTEQDADGLMAVLPKSVMQLPRAKPLPTPKPKTTWQKFAEKKGIEPRAKRSAMVWSEELQEFRPRHGPKSAKHHPLHDWVQEVDE